MASFMKSAMDRLTGGSAALSSSASSSASGAHQQPLSSDEEDDYPQHATNPTLHGHAIHHGAQQLHDDDSGTHPEHPTGRGEGSGDTRTRRHSPPLSVLCGQAWTMTLTWTMTEYMVSAWV